MSLCQHEDLLVDRFELLYQKHFLTLANRITEDIRYVSPESWRGAERGQVNPFFMACSDVSA